MSNHDARCMTAEECTDALVAHFVKDVLATAEDYREIAISVIFGVLVALDGESLEVPGFSVATSPHPDDEIYHKNRGENWWPSGVKLHELHHRFIQAVRTATDNNKGKS